MTVAVSDTSKMRSLLFEVTYECNHHCLHCYNVWRSPSGYPREVMSTELACQVFERLVQQNDVRQVTLTGGEPLLHAELPLLVDRLRALGLQLNLITNGSLLEPEVLARLCPKKIDIFELPLLSVDRAIHDELSGSSGAFDRTTAAIAELKANGQRVVAVFVATRVNLPQFKRTMELAFAIGCDGLMFNRFNPGGAGLGHRQRLETSPGDIVCAIEQAEAFAQQYGFGISCGVPMPPCVFDVSKYQRVSFGLCGAGTERSYYTVDPAGRLRPCNHSPTILGDLKLQSLTEILAGSSMTRFVDALPAGCAGCRVASECRGGCKAVSEQCHGTPDVLDEWIERYGAERRAQLVQLRPARERG
jgi:radical SAM protein with 4Fe4S-binding SPASM domain